jgi:hypothetical protein
MSKAQLHVNQQFRVYRKIHEMDFKFNQEQVKDMLARDYCRKGEVFLTKCVASKDKRDPFFVAMNNIGEVNVVLYSKNLQVSF